MKKALALFQILLLLLAVSACYNEEVTDIKSLLPEKSVAADSGEEENRIIFSSVEQMTAVCDCVIEGEVADSGTPIRRYDELAGSENSMTAFTVTVQNVLLGENVPDTICILQTKQEVSYRKGEHIISFLYALEDVPNYMSVGREEGNFRVVRVVYNEKPVDLIQSFSSRDMLQYDGKSLSDFLQLVK